MKTGSSKMKNMIVSHAINGSRAAELLKLTWRGFRSVLKASPNLVKVKMDVEKLKDIHVLDHLLKRKKHRSYSDDGIGINILTPHSMSTPAHDVVVGHNSLSLMMERNPDGWGASVNLGGCSVRNTVSVEEVDELADAFISRFYNNMRLEKQRSYRSYQEMLARGT